MPTFSSLNHMIKDDKNMFICSSCGHILIYDISKKEPLLLRKL